jgi:hypothetical protein
MNKIVFLSRCVMLLFLIVAGTMLGQTCDVGHVVSKNSMCQCGDTVQILACQGTSGQCQNAIDFVACGSSCSVGSSRDGCSPLGMKKGLPAEVLNATCIKPANEKPRMQVDFPAQTDWIDWRLNW